ncbi:MAG: hypothetical protein QW046_05985 [Candidatus Micrarchaeaceae archaeon]
MENEQGKKVIVSLGADTTRENAVKALQESLKRIRKVRPCCGALSYGNTRLVIDIYHVDEEPSISVYSNGHSSDVIIHVNSHFDEDAIPEAETLLKKALSQMTGEKNDN